jgi:hypothetical protein
MLNYSLNESTLKQIFLFLFVFYKSPNPTPFFPMLMGSQINSNKTSIDKMSENTSAGYLTNKSDHQIESEKNFGHVIIVHIIPSVMHLSAYIMGFIYFRIRESEQLYALMEKVFLSVNQSIKQVSQDKVIKRLRFVKTKIGGFKNY